MRASVCYVVVLLISVLNTIAMDDRGQKEERRRLFSIGARESEREEEEEGFLRSTADDEDDIMEEEKKNDDDVCDDHERGKSEERIKANVAAAEEEEEEEVVKKGETSEKKMFFVPVPPVTTKTKTKTTKRKTNDDDKVEEEEEEEEKLVMKSGDSTITTTKKKRKNLLATNFIYVSLTAEIPEKLDENENENGHDLWFFADIWVEQRRSMKGAKRLQTTFKRMDGDGKRVPFFNCLPTGTWSDTEEQSSLRSIKATTQFIERNLDGYNKIAKGVWTNLNNTSTDTKTKTTKEKSTMKIEKIEPTTINSIREIRLKTNKKTVSLDGNPPYSRDFKGSGLPREFRWIFADVWGRRVGKEERNDFEFRRLDAVGNFLNFDDCGRNGEYSCGKSCEFLRSYKSAVLFITRNIHAYRLGELNPKSMIVSPLKFARRKKLGKQVQSGGAFDKEDYQIVSNTENGNDEPMEAPPILPWGGFSPPTVTIIGAGPAGLSAAKLLHNHGLNVVVLESRDRTGGRCHSYDMKAMPEHDLPAITVDLGAAYVHGCHTFNVLYVIAQENKIKLDQSSGGYSAGWGENAPWYDIVKGGRIKENEVKTAFRVVRKVEECMFSEDRADAIASVQATTNDWKKQRQRQQQQLQQHASNTQFFENGRDDDCMAIEARNTNQISTFDFSSDSIEQKQQEKVPTATDNLILSNELRNNRNKSIDEPIEDAFKRAFDSYLCEFPKSVPRNDIVESVKTINWGYVAPTSLVSTNIVRTFYRERIQAEETLEADKKVSSIEVQNGWIYTTTSSPSVKKEKKEKAKTKTKSEKNDGGEALAFKGSLGDGLVVGGYRDLLINRAAEGLDIRFNKRVRKISEIERDWAPSQPPSMMMRISSEDALATGKDDVEICCSDAIPSPKENDEEEGREYVLKNRCVVETEDGEKFESEFVICTVPLGVLQRNIIEFSPSLSVKKQNAINAVGMGTENKVILRFSRKFWPNFKYIQCNDYRYRFLNYEPFGKKGTIVVHCAPPYAHDYENQTDDVIVKEVCNVMQKMFRVKDMPAPVDFIVTRWLQDENSFGAYSYMKVGATYGDVRALSDPEFEAKSLFFAGEGCSISGAQCVHGAVLSGQEQACKILQFGNVEINSDLALGKRVGIPADATREWMQCSKCSKWRRLPDLVFPDELQDEWECSFGEVWSATLEQLGCGAPEDEESDSDGV